MADSSDHMRILQAIEDGEITAAEGLERLGQLAAAGAAGTAATEPDAPAPSVPAELRRWRHAWLVPLTGGAGLTVVGALFMYLALAASGLSLWLACAALPFAAGVLLLALAGASRSARWIHLRVTTGQTEWPQRIVLSFPLPIRLTAWALRTFGHRLPQLKQHGVDELILALAETATPDAPLYVEVDEAGTGEHVQVYIG